MEETSAEEQGKSETGKGSSGQGCVRKLTTTMGNWSVILGRNLGSEQKSCFRVLPCRSGGARVFIHIKSHQSWLRATPKHSSPDTSGLPGWTDPEASNSFKENPQAEVQTLAVGF